GRASGAPGRGEAASPPGRARGARARHRASARRGLHRVRPVRRVRAGDALDAVGARRRACDLRADGVREGLRGAERALRQGPRRGDLGAGAVTFKDHFSGAASGYAAHRPVYPRAVAEALADRSPGRTLAWDAGCGSGQLSAVLGEVFERVVATDASAAQI